MGPCRLETTCRLVGTVNHFFLFIIFAFALETNRAGGPFFENEKS